MAHSIKQLRTIGLEAIRDPQCIQESEHGQMVYKPHSWDST